MGKKVVIGTDHLGLEMKNALVEHLRGKGHEVEDIGVHEDQPVDYPDIALELAERIARGEHERGILICGTGLGMAITANKVPGVRAASVSDPYAAERAIASNNAQVITMGALNTGPNVAKMLADIWLSNEFQGGGSARKVDKMNEIDARYREQRTS
ncbi:ribose 5-phosphate isomerase B [Pararhizobium mangrovi]|uniref:Ribose 5-phosphate isomerase B n=1 Tax=Pararhizobium mangrovi TaxID=2590452 RepID=A0A506TYV9_9HYPH|nr:ribose 5-phosphate isomerase B [Pararhizobium mangrovi]TPW26171.1 ribose 5-phosphate isomerase B [Pararhizobium mangrovi]